MPSKGILIRHSSRGTRSTGKSYNNHQKNNGKGISVKQVCIYKVDFFHYVSPFFFWWLMSKTKESKLLELGIFVKEYNSLRIESIQIIILFIVLCIFYYNYNIQILNLCANTMLIINHPDMSRKNRILLFYFSRPPNVISHNI